MNDLKKDKRKSEKSRRNSESKTSKTSKKEVEEKDTDKSKLKEHKHKTSDKSKSKHKGETNEDKQKEDKSKVKVEVEKAKPIVAENSVLRLSSKSPSKQRLHLSTENLATSQERAQQENSPRDYIPVRRGPTEVDNPQPLVRKSSCPNISEQDADNIPKSPQGIILRSFATNKDNLVNNEASSASTIGATSVPSASRIRIVGNRPAVKQNNNVYYSCPTKKLMDNPPPKSSSSRYGTMHIPTDAEEQEAANNKLNEHSYANVRARDKLSDDESKVTEVKVSDFAGVNSSLSGSSKPTGLEVKRVKQHKKVGSDGIADLKKLYQVERQQQAEIFLLDFISSDEASDPVTKAHLIVKCLNQWQFGMDLMNNIIKSCESSMEANQFSRKKIFSWATTNVCIWYFSQPESKYQLVPVDIYSKATNFKPFIKKIESSISKAFEHTWSHFLSNMDPLWKQSISECLRNSIDSIQHYSSLEDTIQKLMDYSTIVKESFVFSGIESQFFGRIFQWVLNTIVSTLKKDGCTSLQGIQMRIIITEIMEFSRKIGYHDTAKTILHPANEICNMLCYQKKHLFCDKKEREDVCPTLSPWLMAEVLENYKHTNEEIAISKNYLDELRSLGEPLNEIIQPYKPLEFNFEILPHPEFPTPIMFPSQFVEHPGFEFLL